MNNLFYSSILIKINFMKKLTLIFILLLNLFSYSQIKFKAIEYYEEDIFTLVADTTKCDIYITDDNWNREIKIKKTEIETVYKYDNVEINRPMFLADTEREREKSKSNFAFDFKVIYFNVTDKYNENKCIYIYKLKKGKNNKSYYLITIRKSVCSSITYKAELIQGNFPE